MKNKILDIFSEPFIMTNDTVDCRELDFRIYGLHKKETFDTNGDLTLLQYYKNYDENGFADLAVEERRTYTRDVDTGLPLTRITDIDWYDDQGVVQAQKLLVTKYYSTKKGFVANKRARRNIIEVASMYLFSQLIANDPVNAEVNVDDFETLTDTAQSNYIKSNTVPLLAIITNSTDDQSPDYRTYITAPMQTALLAILDITYN